MPKRGKYRMEKQSCLVPHDDDSAEVEHLGWGGRGAGRKRGEISAEYETLWACCGKTVEGNGNMGPPDGWCYEGKHTTDPKRARFRVDSTIHHDKLVSCLKLNCHGIRSHFPTTKPSTRKRASRKVSNLHECHTASEEEEGTEGPENSGVEEIVEREQRGGSDTRGHGRGEAGADTDVESVKSMSKSVPSTRGRPPKRTLSTTLHKPSPSNPAPTSKSKPIRKQTLRSKVQDTPSGKTGAGARKGAVSDTDQSTMDVNVNRTSPSRARTAPRSRARPSSKRPAKKPTVDANADNHKGAHSHSKNVKSPPRRAHPRMRSRSRLGMRHSGGLVGSAASSSEEAEQLKKRCKVAA
ncbi:hypothetical protein SERLA73DRAFT_162619 [Serpula lacrymans var. lacrymans S7.3]|uniref:Uncharacterized protein n=1 Tax=Serpula lacrymans var. lacrymans (strain S7.3) TaxID=936435 RepID=F8Q8U2_SERL3|nr:hypothetical protein SERLA73DRAFT_162619 [Serpula lacrymans var. lacrymans S7.3]